MCPGHRLDLFPIRELRDTCLCVQSVLSPSGLRWHEERILVRLIQKSEACCRWRFSLRVVRDSETAARKQA